MEVEGELPMSDTVGTLAGLMRADAEALRTIAHNIANAESVAYRRAIPVARAGADFGFDLERMSLETGAPGFESAVDLRPGTLQSTGNPFDLAIEGAGFFVIGTATGEAFARRGDFRLDALGYLVTQSGDPVLGTSGPLRVGTEQPAIAADGTVRNGDEIVGRLRIVEPDAGARFAPTNTGELTLTDGHVIDAGTSYVRQGFLETSNVQSVSEMVRLMEVMRWFEAGQRFVHGYDSMVEQAISTLGRV
jgi:flagellar basal-body rod protein FlgF